MRRVTRYAVLLLAMALWPGAAGAQPKLPCDYGERKCAEKAKEGHASHKLDLWKPALARPLEERIGIAPPELVEYLALDNIHGGIPNKPRAAQPSQEFLRDVRLALAELPPRVIGALLPKLGGIHFVEDFGSTGFLIYPHDEKGTTVGVMILDPVVLGKYPANAWATWKENTPFKPAPGLSLQAVIEKDGEDSRKNAIQYILLHELGHVLPIGRKAHPMWVVPPPKPMATADYPFFELSWAVAEKERRYVTKFDSTFTQRKDVRYYFGAKLPGEQMLQIYEALEKTNFPTLYAATHPFDDLAESFVTYVHTVLMGKPFAIRIFKDGKLAKEFGACWNEPRCAEKRKLLEQLLGS
jgi:hypothetical protein